MAGDSGPASAPRCLFCGEPERIEIAEMWSDHTFLLEACCEAQHDMVAREMADDPAWARWLLRRLGAEDLAGHRLRRLADDGGGAMLLDWQLRIAPVTLAAAKAFVTRHHRHCRAPQCWRFGTAVFNGASCLGVVMAGNPVARALCGRGILEINRLCIRRDIPSTLAWNAASKLYGWAARTAQRQGWSKIITYTRSDESGRSLVAAGFIPEAKTRGRGWHSARRSRSNTNSDIDKVRWSRILKPKPSRAERQDPPPAPDRPAGWLGTAPAHGSADAAAIGW